MSTYDLQAKRSLKCVLKTWKNKPAACGKSRETSYAYESGKQSKREELQAMQEMDIDRDIFRQLSKAS
jgi:hypothetical protein